MKLGGHSQFSYHQKTQEKLKEWLFSKKPFLNEKIPNTKIKFSNFVENNGEFPQFEIWIPFSNNEYILTAKYIIKTNDVTKEPRIDNYRYQAINISNPVVNTKRENSCAYNGINLEDDKFIECITKIQKGIPLDDIENQIKNQKRPFHFVSSHDKYKIFYESLKE